MFSHQRSAGQGSYADSSTDLNRLPCGIEMTIERMG